MNVPVTCVVISFLLSCIYLFHWCNISPSSQKISAMYPYTRYNPGQATPAPDDDMENLVHCEIINIDFISNIVSPQIKVFASVAAVPPVEKVNSSCVAPSLTSPAEFKCKGFQYRIIQIWISSYEHNDKLQLSYFQIKD